VGFFRTVSRMLGSAARPPLASASMNPRMKCRDCVVYIIHP
jgi:hypothetical protein